MRLAMSSVHPAMCDEIGASPDWGNVSRMPCREPGDEPGEMADRAVAGAPRPGPAPGPLVKRRDPLLAEAPDQARGGVCGWAAGRDIGTADDAIARGAREVQAGY
jgi:hypothetical protein